MGCITVHVIRVKQLLALDLHRVRISLHARRELMWRTRMKFHLRTLLGLVTVACLLLAVGLRIINHRNRVHQHRLAFLNVDSSVSSLDSELRRHILQMPAVAAQLRQANPVDPPMALGQSVTGESKAFGTYEFARVFHYHWQLADGSRCEGIKVTAASVLKEGSLDGHLVRLTYEPSELNDEVASWIGEQLERNAHVQVEEVRLSRRPSVPHELADDGNVAIESWSGLR